MSFLKDLWNYWTKKDGHSIYNIEKTNEFIEKKYEDESEKSIEQRLNDIRTELQDIIKRFPKRYRDEEDCNNYSLGRIGFEARLIADKIKI